MVPYHVCEIPYIAAVVYVNDSYDEMGVQGQSVDRLPPFAISESLVVVTEIAESHNGRADLVQLRHLLLAIQCDAVFTTISEVYSDMEYVLHVVWQRILDRRDTDSNASFFVLGGTLLNTIRAKGNIKWQLDLEINITDLFEYPTLTVLTYFLDTAVPPKNVIPARTVAYGDMPVMIVGMVGRFLSAVNTAALWTLVIRGESGLTLFSDEELYAYDVIPDTLKRANHIKTRRIIDGHEWFDVDFFGYTPDEAECMGSQIRLLYQHC